MLNNLSIRKDDVPSAIVQSAASAGFTVMLPSTNRRSLDQLLSIVECIAGINITTKQLKAGEFDPLLHSDAEQQPDLLIYWLDERWQPELTALIEHPVSQRIPIIIVSDCHEQAAMRMAMKAGAIDYLRPPFDSLELQSSINELMNDQNCNEKNVTITSVINAKGGSGASLFSCTLAHMMAKLNEKKVALIDMDIQFGSLCHYFNMDSKYGLIEALQNAFELDEVALEGYMLKHESGLDLLDIKPGDFILPEDIHSEHMDVLLKLMAKKYEHIVVDMPRHLDALSCLVLESSDKVVVVLQQSISHLRDAKRLLDILRNDLGIDKERILVVLNRYDKNNDLSLKDIQKTLNHPVSTTLPNAYKVVSESVNQGVPLYDVASRSPIIKSMHKISNQIIDPDGQESRKKGLFNRLFG
ncbi:MAG: AAA family ATPase [Pseudomonadales bacterium]|nr:AAA family ATPase [Pseudomonadales bacterium]